MTWVFQAANALTVKRWSEKASRDTEKSLAFAPLMYGNDTTAMRNPDYNKMRGAIEVYTDFQGKTGDRVTVPNVRPVTGRGVHGDQLLRGTGASQNLDSMDLYFENFAHQVISGGKLSERRIALDFLKTARRSLSDWYMRKVEEAIVLALWGLTSWYGTPLKNFGGGGTSQAETKTFLNPIQAFDSSHIVYGGDATSDATLDASDRMCAQLISKTETTAQEDLDIPLEPMLTEDGEDCFVLMLSGRQCEDLRYDQDWKDSQAGLKYKDPGNALLRRAIGKYGKTYVVEYPKCLQPRVNVTRGIFLGRDALKLAKVEELEFYQDPADDAKRRTALSVGGSMGVAPSYFNGTRRGAIAVDTWTRT